MSVKHLLPILLLLWSFAQETDTSSPGVFPTAGPNPKAT